MNSVGAAFSTVSTATITYLLSETSFHKYFQVNAPSDPRTQLNVIFVVHRFGISLFPSNGVKRFDSLMDKEFAYVTIRVNKQQCMLGNKTLNFHVMAVSYSMKYTFVLTNYSF